MAALWAKLAQIWVLFFGWLPAPLAIGFTVLIGLFIVIMILKLVAFVLDAIPFL